MDNRISQISKIFQFVLMSANWSNSTIALFADKFLETGRFILLQNGLKVTLGFVKGIQKAIGVGLCHRLWLFW
jgi:hypothetical protein